LHQISHLPTLLCNFQDSGNGVFSHVTAIFVNMPFNKEVHAFHQPSDTSTHIHHPLLQKKSRMKKYWPLKRSVCVCTYRCDV